VDGPSYQKALYFRGGRILFGSSNDPRDQLGAILIESGRITPEQLEEVNAKVGTGKPLAKVLADSGFVSQRELGEAARAKVERILSDVIAYDSGSFEFEDGVLPKGAVDLKLSTERLVLAAVRRIGDRGFVLRHVDGMETVLAPTEAMTAARPEVQPEAAGLPDALDGRMTLKEAAAHARLDEFEATKIACALMFLGLVKPEPLGERTEAGSELDLVQTARMAFDGPATAEPATIIMEPSAPAPPEPAPSAHEVGFAFVETPRFEVDAEPIVIDTDPPPITDAPTLILPEPLPLAPPRAITPPARPTPPPRPRAVQTPDPAPAAPPPTRPPSRPSKDDLAALDALLNTRSVEGPMAPLEKQPQAWEPRFGQPSARVAKRQGAVGLRMPLVIAVGVLVLLGSGALAWRFLGTSTANPPVKASPAAAPSARPTPPAPPAATPDPSTVAASSQPSAEPTSAVAVPPDLTLATAAPTPAATAPASAPSTSAPKAKATGAAPTLAEARGLLRRGSLNEAARGFASSLRQSAAGGFSIQLLVACSPETVEKALASVADPDLYILPVNYKGRPCYRVCWGLYDSEARAESAIRTVPGYFRGGSTPRVMPTSGLLP
jgi:septal ring-binding cell division protein DamX